jgi:ribonuclease HI/probable phosphoglycerate mutase
MIYINSDGGARGNPGPAAVGVVLREDDKILLKYSEKLKAKVTNNYAEYMGLIRALQLANKQGVKKLTCILDSELVVNQLLGKYRVKSPKLLKLFLKVQELEKNFEKITYRHVKRSNKYQKIADYLLNKELDKPTKI